MQKLLGLLKAFDVMNGVCVCMNSSQTFSVDIFQKYGSIKFSEAYESCVCVCLCSFYRNLN